MTRRNYDTVTEAIADLIKRGYTHDFTVVEGDDCLVCHQHKTRLSPEEFGIDEMYRFEGDSDPGDEMIVYGISSEKFGIKGFLVNAFGIYANSQSFALIEKLRRKHD